MSHIEVQKRVIYNLWLLLIPPLVLKKSIFDQAELEQKWDTEDH